MQQDEFVMVKSRKLKQWLNYIKLILPRMFTVHKFLMKEITIMFRKYENGVISFVFEYYFKSWLCNEPYQR